VRRHARANKHRKKAQKRNTAKPFLNLHNICDGFAMPARENEPNPPVSGLPGNIFCAG